MEATERGRPVVAGVHAGALGYWVCSSCLERKLHDAVASWCRLVVPGVDDASCKGVGLDVERRLSYFQPRRHRAQLRRQLGGVRNKKNGCRGGEERVKGRGERCSSEVRM